MTIRARKIFSVILNIVIALFLVVAALAFVIPVTYAARGEDVTLFGRQFRIVVSESMEPNIHKGDLVVIETVWEDEEEFYRSLQVGDVITFRWQAAGREVAVTHRITEIEENGGNPRFTLKGDAVENDTQVFTASEGRVIGRVISNSSFFGGLLRFVRSDAGIVCCLIVPAAAIAAVEITRIVRLVREGRKEKKDEEAAERDAELERLRREVEELKKERREKDE